MPKSNYPESLDTSAEIPPVRDNITEIGSDVINSLRSAIFNIERVLGINPQGSSGNTVASRISNALDENGNIKNDALSKANVLAGPIIDSDVSKVAAIQESKLKLNFPTSLLQDEISILNSNIEIMNNAIEELSVLFAKHTQGNALNSHNAVSINVEDAAVISSDIASLSLASGTLQDIFEELYNAHINYSGANVSSTNNSHSASQIFFDNNLVSNYILSDDVQGALVEVAGTGENSSKRVTLNTSSNGRIRTGKVEDGYEGNGSGTVLLDETSATYIQANGSSTTTFSISEVVAPLGTISEFDILTLSGSSTESDNKEYQIYSHTLDGSGNITSVTVYGGPLGPSSLGLLIKISKNQYQTYNPAGFLPTVRPRSTKTNTPDIQILNPDSATIISTGIDPTNITSTANSFDISVDDGPSVTITTYDASSSQQSIDSIVQKINDQAIDQHLNFTAFKIRKSACYELAIAHNIPNFSSDYKNRTLTISAGSTNDGTSVLGFSNILNETYEGTTKNKLHLNGSILEDFGLIQVFDSSSIQLNTGFGTLSLVSGSFVELGVRVGDLIIIENSSDSSDDGSFRVGSISGSDISIDLSGFLFSGYTTSNTKVYILRASANIDDLTFEEIMGSDGTIIFDVFADEYKDYFVTKRLEVEGSLSSGNFTAVVSNVSDGFILNGDTATINIGTDGYATLTDPSLFVGEQVFVGVSGTYHLFGSDGISFVTLDVNAAANPPIAQSVTLYGFDEISQNNYRICRGSFATGLGRILGNSTDPGIPSLLDTRNSGTADHTIVGESFIEKYIEGPRNELRTSGVVKGCLVSNVTYNAGPPAYQTFDVGAGIVYVDGIRYEFPGATGVRIDTSDDYYIAIDSRGCVIARAVIDNPSNPGEDISPFFQQNVATLAEVTNDLATATSTDLRLFVDNLDLKVLGDVKVASDIRYGHFTDIESAVAYSKRFTKMFPDSNRPTIQIENGTYTISSTILIDFDLSIYGSGPNTVLTKGGSLATGTALSGDNFDMGTSIFMIGGGSDTNASEITYGVSISDFTYKCDDSLLTNVGVVFSITQPLIKSAISVSEKAVYRFENIFFEGPSTMDGSVGDPNKIGEYALVIGQQNSSTLVPVTNIDIGNVIFTNNRVDSMGVETGCIKITESANSTLKNIIISNNIVTNASPNVASTASVLLEYPVTPTMSIENIIESGNTFSIT